MIMRARGHLLFKHLEFLYKLLWERTLKCHLNFLQEVFHNTVIIVYCHSSIWCSPPAGEHPVSVLKLKWKACWVVTFVFFQKMSAYCSSCTASQWWPWLLQHTRLHCGTQGQWRQNSTFQQQLCASLKLSSCSWAWASWLSKYGNANQYFGNESLLLTSDSQIPKHR